MRAGGEKKPIEESHQQHDMARVVYAENKAK